MADVCDIADEQIEQSLQEGIRAVQKNRQARGLIPTGRCHYCDEGIAHGLFCPPVDADGDGCARDYDAEQRARRISGAMH